MSPVEEWSRKSGRRGTDLIREKVYRLMTLRGWEGPGRGQARTGSSVRTRWTAVRRTREDLVKEQQIPKLYGTKRVESWKSTLIPQRGIRVVFEDHHLDMEYEGT